MTKIVLQIACDTHRNGYYTLPMWHASFVQTFQLFLVMFRMWGLVKRSPFQEYFLFDILPNWLIKIEEDCNVFNIVIFTRNQPLINDKQREYRIQAIINFVPDTVAKWRWLLLGTRKTELWIWKYWLWITSPISARLTRFVSAQLPDGWADFKNNHDEIRLMS